MSLPEDNRLSDALRRDCLTAQDAVELEAFLASHPAERARWEEELALNQLLRQVPNAPLSFNFTARVLQAAGWEASNRESSHRRVEVGWLRRWLPQVTAVSAALLIGLFTFHQQQLAARRDLAQDLAEMTALGANSPLEVLENFQAIETLNQVPVDLDKELIAALQ